ncbi:hypothetical protein [Aquitalea magnusonii]|uniref:hypothetical protein n=1 Tax=Aquitalea magnusonii TaxID=332411 RepID=UPI001EFBAFC2|nr:hypothetical protein [Aquitalea magnusonii]
MEFAEAHVRIWPYPYQTGNSIRNEVFTRRGACISAAPSCCNTRPICFRCCWPWLCCWAERRHIPGESPP